MIRERRDLKEDVVAKLEKRQSIPLKKLTINRQNNKTSYKKNSSNMISVGRDQ